MAGITGFIERCDMQNPHRILVTINRKAYKSGVFDITPKEFTHREVEMILGNDFKQWVLQNRFTPEMPWKIECVKDEAIDYDCA